MEKIRILHVAQAAGGVDRYIRMLLKYSNKQKYEHILVCSQDYKKENYENLVIAFEQVKMGRNISKQDVKAVANVRELIKKYTPNIVYAHSSKAGAIARMADIGIRNKCIYNPHGWAFNMIIPEMKQRMYVLIERLAAHFCDKIICISDSEKESAIRNKICGENKIQVIFNGIDVEAYEKSRHKLIKKSDLGISDDSFVVGMVGRLSQQKAPDMFIRVAKLVKDKVPNAYFIIVGSGEMEQEVKNYAEKNGFLDSLYITGWVENPLSFVELFDVACLFSRWEGFGLVLPEYMMVGKPIVATNIDAIPNIIKNRENGILVNVDDCVEASDAVIQIKNDNQLYNLLRSGGLESVKKFDARRVSYEHEKLFASMKV